VPLRSITPWINWAQTDTTHAPILRSAGIKVDIYTSYWRNHSTDYPILGYDDLKPGGAHAAAEAVDCSGNAIIDPTYGGGYVADSRSSAALGHAQVVVNNRTAAYGTNWDAVFSDTTATVYGITKPCGYDEQSFNAAINSVHTAMGTPLFLNALGDKSSHYTTMLVQPSNVLGAMCELCYGLVSGGVDTVDKGSHWQYVENNEIGVVAQHKIWWDYARVTGDPTTETALRTYIYASFLLSYDPAYTMFQEKFQTPSGFPVMPETGLVPLQPRTTASSVSGYLATGGAYFREFGACYYRGAYVNKCAVAVNPGTATVTIPSTSYSHTMTVAGGGVLDGGTISFTGPNVTQLAPASAAILFP
jgi:hypothetical protein